MRIFLALCTDKKLHMRIRRLIKTGSLFSPILRLIRTTLSLLELQENRTHEEPFNIPSDSIKQTNKQRQIQINEKINL